MSPACTILPLYNVLWTAAAQCIACHPKRKKIESSTVQLANSKLLVSVKYYKQTKNEE